jgi:hypothetical protein
MDTDNSSLRSRPSQTVVLKENLAKIDAELLRCRERVEDLKLMQSLEAKASHMENVRVG